MGSRAVGGVLKGFRGVGCQCAIRGGIGGILKLNWRSYSSS